MLLAALVLLHVPAEIRIDRGLALPPVSRYGRDPAPIDPIALQFALGRWQAPKEGDEVEGVGGRKGRWSELRAGPDGAFTGPAMNGGYLYVSVESPKRQVMILEAAGHGSVYVNGEPRAGDTYSYGFVKLPVRLKQGRNDFVFNVPRGRMTARLVEPKEDFFFNPGDTTLPDIVGNKGPGQGAIVVVNASEQPLSDLTVVATFRGAEPIRTRLRGSIPALSCRKIGFDIPEPGIIVGSSCKLWLRLERAGKQSEEIEVDIRVRSPQQTRKVTFTSIIDGSVQYYAVVPRSGDSKEPGATVLSLHGAGVEAIGQADSYSPKDWCTIVCPTNRRPYGFDWEDWGRLDALEVLNRFPKPYFLTGHSMGGHGTWHLGVTFPGLFQGIGPSAGWVSFWSYAGGRRYTDPDPVEQILQRAASPSDTEALVRNLIGEPVYVLHGDKDDNVPVTEARRMRDLLQPIHPDFRYFEQPGAGHWWDVSPDPGVDCVDWKPMFEMFRSAIKTSSRFSDSSSASLRTFDPGISSSNSWVQIVRQTEPLRLSSVDLKWNASSGRIEGTTKNVELIHLRTDLLPISWPLTIDLDGQIVSGIERPHGRFDDRKREHTDTLLERTSRKWKVVSKVRDGKDPALSGPFKNAFRNQMLFVYGTHGTAEENTWAYAKARFDAETFWYRGNGSVEVIPDTRYDPKENSRNVILYGHAQSNSAWSKLLKDSPLQVRRGWLRIGSRVIRGEDKGVLFAYPYRPGGSPTQAAKPWDQAAIEQAPKARSVNAERRLVGVVSGTGPVGMRLTDRLPYFVSGVAYPDWTIISPDIYKLGSKGIIGAGFFDNEWRYSALNSAWTQ